MVQDFKGKNSHFKNEIISIMNFKMLLTRSNQNTPLNMTILSSLCHIPSCILYSFMVPVALKKKCYKLPKHNRVLIHG